MSSNNLDFFKKNILNSCLDSFGNRSQFIELVFNNSNFEEIRMSLDCMVLTKNANVEAVVNPLKSFSKDMFSLAYFITVNNQKVVECYSTFNSITMVFENLVDIELLLNEPFSEIGVGFKKNYSDTEFKGFFLDIDSLTPRSA